jgi:hypothetical protein
LSQKTPEHTWKRLVQRLRTPVQREAAETFLLLTLLSFGASVGLTRLFLEFTGYPQLGSGTFHFAHVLWGGLLLFIAALIPLIYANRWVHSISAVLAGAGVGLFIDEVGKFITRANDYFYPGAAPIIYAFFLLTALMYTRLSRRRSTDPRTEMYYVLTALQEVLDQDLEPQEKDRLTARLNAIRQQADDTALSHLAQSLLDFVKSGSAKTVPELPGPMEYLRRRLRVWEERWVSERRIKALVVGGLSGLAIMALLRLSQVLAAIFSTQHLEQLIARQLILGSFSDTVGAAWFTFRLAIEGIVGLFLLFGAILMLLGRDSRGVTFGYVGLLASLAGVNLLIFYFDQFSTIVLAVVQLSVLINLLYYRRRFVAESGPRLNGEP